MQYFFGSGSLYGRQTGVVNPTPIRFGGVQDTSVDIAFTNKELYGQYQFPLYVARGTAKIAGKATFAQLFGQAFNNLFFGETSLGNTPVFTAIDEQATVTANAVSVAHAGNFVEDLGVLNTATGIIMTRVTAGNEVGNEYSVNESTGNYSFNSSMNNTIVAVTYDYNGASGAGTLITGANQLVGSSPKFLMVLAGSLGGKAMRLKLNACTSSKLTIATKLADYALPAFEFDGFCDDTGNWGQFSFAE